MAITPHGDRTLSSPDSGSAPENVLIILSDEHQRRALGCAGHPVVQTPNLDGLAASGTRFTNCWTPSPICVPARGSLATGRWVHEIDTWDSAQAYAGSPEGWAHAARSSGREVVSFGKLHHRSAADDDGFTERVAPMYVAGGVGWVQGLPRTDPLPYPEAAELAQQTGTGHTTYTRYDERVTEAATDWLRTRPDGAPWVAFVSLVAPHFPLSAPNEFTELYPLADVPPPEIERIERTNAAVEAMAEFFDYDTAFTPELRQQARRAYFGLCSWLDHNVGQLLSALDASGQRTRTRIIYTSDHGELLGNRGLWAKSFMYEDSVAVPMIVAGPDVFPGTTSDENVNLVDIEATVAESLGFPPKGRGRSLWDAARSPDLDRIAFSEYHDGGSITGSFAIRHQNWKLVEHVGYPNELFDLDADPDERVDLGTDPDTSTVRARMGERLREIVDPEEASSRAFESQTALLAHHGGRDAVADAFRFNHTPVPD